MVTRFVGKDRITKTFTSKMNIAALIAAREGFALYSSDGLTIIFYPYEQ
ncbi:hypothetical protein B0I18_103199 [Taibaiella chishuiensis]|uniref:Uncharacterized protein n=1 Tax=Taibaiella chishuiensis TaxID=1434707 RepID=A0A2P8D5Y9_9BACT|nr:hypothetical protein B0I18_103199 [Taibaiella chishuiensis]